MIRLKPKKWLMPLMLFACVPLQAQNCQLFTEYRVNPVLADSVENVILNSSKVTVFVIDTIAMESQREIQGYTIEKKFVLPPQKYKRMVQYILHPTTFIKSEYKVMAPFIPEVAVQFKDRRVLITFLFSLKSSTARIFYNGTLQDEILIDSNHELMFIMKELLIRK